MKYKSINDLRKEIVKNITLFEKFELIVGVPRSGMLPATIIALHLNKQLSDLETFLNGQHFAQGTTRQVSDGQKTIKKVLVVDDSVGSGGSMQKVKEKVENLKDRYNISYFAPYVTRQNKNIVDFYFEVLSIPRAFEWNIMHHPILKEACLDFDGVLCEDPAEAQNDDGKKYIEFILNAKPLFLTKHPVGIIVTSRLEKYRSQTEAWLEKHKIKYEDLIMLENYSAMERSRLQIHGKFKGNFFSKSDKVLFIESNKKQAAEIATLSGKHVLCTEDFKVYEPSNFQIKTHIAKSKSLVKKIFDKFKTISRKLT